MLQIKNINKKYNTGGFEQVALHDVSLALRDNEFVAVLGPSGSGKTTLLNIIGGLDRYDSGDLIIDGVSTRKYKDRDWDSYRNHTVGFVFQSYNLIPHQTVLQNVELALTIGGISSGKRQQMALDALEKVGLRDQAHKHPNQMSGGQMQRVAIARALVNDPKILLADEPTGALDTKTSLQVMELLKEVASDRLVVMVTHNPELAEKYANRIVRLKDGDIISDTNPLTIENEEPAVHKNLGKASMSVLTAFGLSLNNLMTKKGRTILTAFAGSIGIIGIALILALSTGFQNYIDQIQEETMNSYPLTISAEAGDFASVILSMNSSSGDKPSGDVLVEKQYISDVTNSFTENDLKTFKGYLETHPQEYQDYVQMVKYNYAVTPMIYTIDAEDNLAKINPNDNMNNSAGSMTFLSNFGSSSMSTFTEMTNPEMIREDYEILAGRWPERYNELVISLSDPNEISDLLLYSLGLRDTTELDDLIKSMYLGEKTTINNEPMKITYNDLLGLDLRLIDPSQLYKYNDEYDIYEDMTDDDDYMMDVYRTSEPLTVVGIIWHGDSNNNSSVGVLYLPELTQHVIEKAGKTEIVRKQLDDPDRDVFSGNLFDDEDDDDELDFQDMISVDEDMLKEAFQVNGDFGNMSIDEEDMQNIIMESSKAVVENIDEVTQSMVTALTKADSAFADGLIKGYQKIATITVKDSKAPETHPDVSAVTKILEGQLETAREQAEEKARPAATEMVEGQLETVKARLAAGVTVKEAEEIVDSLGLDEETADSLKALIMPAGSGYGARGMSGDVMMTGASYDARNMSAKMILAADQMQGAEEGSAAGEGSDNESDGGNGSDDGNGTGGSDGGSGNGGSDDGNGTGGNDDGNGAGGSDDGNGTGGNDDGNGNGGNTGDGSGSTDDSSGDGSSAGGEGGAADGGSAGDDSGAGDDGAAGNDGGSGSDESEEQGGGSDKANVTALIAALDQMKEPMIEQAVKAAVTEATKPIQDLIDELNNAETKAEADAVVDKMGLDDTQASYLKSQIKKQYESGSKTTDKKYITLAYLDAYKEKAITEKSIREMTEKIKEIKIDPANAKKIAEEAFDNYYGSLKPDETGMVPVDELPSTEKAINQAVEDNSALLFEEGYNLAKEYMALLVAKGTGEAVAKVMAPLSDLFSGGEDLLSIDTDKFAEAFQFEKDEDELQRIMTAMLTNSKTTYTNNLLKLGFQEADKPSSISFYFRDFETKNLFSDFLTKYNDEAPEKQKLQYTDLTGILMGSVETIVNAVTYVLIAFVSISLIVSSIMIGIITYISVLERTKEIGILRAIGASKRNISTIFNAETFIIGFLSGLIGVGVTRLLLFPVNDVIHRVTEIDDITAVLSLPAALVLIAIATILTIIGGLIPSRSASRKDPVIALRTE